MPSIIVAVLHGRRMFPTPTGAAGGLPRGRRSGLVSCALAAMLLLALPAGAIAEPKPGTRELQVEPIDVDAKPLAGFDRANSEARRFGKLEFRGGLVMSSPNPHFGGWSGIAVEPDGKRFVAVSDAGAWMTGEILYDGVRPKGVTNAKIGPLLAANGRTLGRERDRDAEAVAIAEGNLAKGAIYIGFERNHRIGRFEIGERGVGAPTGYLKNPPEARRMSANKGYEAVAVLQAGPHKGSVVAFAERLYDKPTHHHTGWIWIGGEPQRLFLKDIDEFDVTGATGLPDGGLVVIERRFRWYEGVKTRLRRIKPGEIRSGAVLAGEVLLTADMSYEIDNMEGVAVHKGPRGETVLTIVSDDNFNHFLQRNLLLQFAIVEPGGLTATQPK